jgi:hypothetical protein
MQLAPRTLALINIISLGAVLTVNYLSNALPLNGKTPGELSDQYPNLFVPAGLTFAIWGVIYTWLLVWGVWQLVALFHSPTLRRITPALEKTGPLFISTCLYNIVWLLAWHWEQVLLSVLVMCMLFLRLVRINNQSRVGFSATTAWEKWVMHAPFGIYWGWISIALIANVTAFLVKNNWSGFGQPESFWAIVMIGSGTLLAGIVVWTRNNIFYGLAVAWALYGIYLKRSSIPADSVTPLELANSQLVGVAALSCLVAVLLAVALRTKAWVKY